MMFIQDIEIGKPVTYYSWIDDDGVKRCPKETFVASAPWQLGDGSIVCKVQGVSGGVFLTHLDPR